MRDRIAKLFIGLAVLLILGDLVWVFPRLAAALLDAVRRAPETALLAGALCLLLAAWAIRSGRPGGRRENEEPVAEPEIPRAQTKIPWT
jgi:hypothetical protein